MQEPERKNPTTCCACHHRCEMRSEHQNWFSRRRARRGVESPTRCATCCDRRSDTEIKSNSALRPSWPAADGRLAPPTRATTSTRNFRPLSTLTTPRSPSPCAHESHTDLPSQTLASDCAARESMRSYIRKVISLRWASGWHGGLTSFGQGPLIFQNVSPAPSSVKCHQFRLLAHLSTIAECRQRLSGSMA